MDLLANIPSWDDIERNLDDKFNTLNQAYSDGLQSTHDSWNGFTRRVSTTATQAYGFMGGNRIDSVKAAMRLSYPIIESNLKRKWASIEIEQILPVLLQLVKEVAMILGGSVAVGTIAGGVGGAIFFGVGAVPGAAAGAGIGLQVGNLILLALGLSSIAEYFYQGLPACLSTFQEGFATAWHADEGLKPEGLDPTGGSAYVMQERIDRAAQQIAKGQEQLVLLLFTAIVTYMTRGQVKAGLMGSMDSIAARSAKLQSEISNKQFANWLARNEQKLLAQPELRVNEPAPFKNAQDPQPDAQGKKPESPPKVEKIERHELGDIIGTYSALDPGPLPPDIAATFTGGRYTVVKLERDTVLNRVGTAEQELGQFFSRYTPDGVIQSRIDRAILPEWPTGGKSPIDTVFNVKIPAGTEVYIGEIGSQGGFYVGGAEQIVVIKPWTIKGIEVMSSGPLK
ncbi:glycine zipper family protein [Pseudomonas syringae pv. tomato]|uniref:Glycine zipper family protein n=4 Tax=Pseudomonas syringae group TaxID=136849 RepID=A0AAW4DQE6_PSESX|nr:MULTISPECIES: hypothetical protein [Pseudomonas]AVI87431.1 glycine zipper family protein [Pseudomonas syringae pv. tomato]EEB57996.1 hypothetical protein PSPTOT1_4093 [Pseudomonas syringae pv. tomato T1]KGK93287.1 hypothetical protein NB04_22055 [Pseudomonas syringae pv. tomato]KPB81990.1 Uncharacterized protein AC505_2766 [Pseudomonas syringae pv. maculicola]KPW37912.1 Uncharacterized protein ALO87_02982 [Pseudomonas syringae pv. apii]